MTPPWSDSAAADRPPRDRSTAEAERLLGPLHEAVAARRGRATTLLFELELRPQCDPLRAWRPRGPRMRWRSPECSGRQQLDVVALGAAHELVSALPGRQLPGIVRQAEPVWRRLVPLNSLGLPQPRFHGGSPFDSESQSSADWRDFSGSRFFLPVLAIYRTASAVRARVAIPCDRRDARAMLEDARHALACTLDSERRFSREIEPSGVGRGSAVVDTDPSSYRDLVGHALRDIRSGRLRKVVLARSARVSDSGASEVSCLRRLAASARDATVYAFGFGDSLFLGATPERLVRKQGLAVSSEALAGTRRRAEAGPRSGMTAKDFDEHGVVVDEVARCLAVRCGAVRIGETSERAAGKAVHLRTPLDARLAIDRHVLELVEDLHPTPAVGGLSRAEALTWIRRHEGLDRGWYAAPIGSFDERGDGELLVALRCALLRDGVVRLFAGAGIVEGSNPDSEVRETELKMQTAGAILGGAGSDRHSDLHGTNLHDSNLHGGHLQSHVRPSRGWRRVV